MPEKIPPTLGRTVLYTLSVDDAAQINKRRTDRSNHVEEQMKRTGAIPCDGSQSEEAPRTVAPPVMQVSLVEAALLDQERRILAARPLDLARTYDRPLSGRRRISRPYCDRGCGRQLHFGRSEITTRTTCKSCLLEGRR